MARQRVNGVLRLRRRHCHRSCRHSASSILNCSGCLTRPRLTTRTSNSLRRVCQVRPKGRSNEGSSHGSKSSSMDRQRRPRGIRKVRRISFHVRREVRRQSRYPKGRRTRRRTSYHRRHQLLRVTRRRTPCQFTRRSSNDRLLHAITGLDRHGVSMIRRNEGRRGRHRGRRSVRRDAVTVLRGVSAVDHGVGLIPSCGLTAPRGTSSVQVLLPSLPMIRMFTRRNLSRFFQIDVLYRSHRHDTKTGLVRHLDLDFCRFRQRRGVM